MKIGEYKHYGKTFEIHKLEVNIGPSGFSQFQPSLSTEETFYGWLQKGDSYSEPLFEHKTEEACINDIKRKF